MEANLVPYANTAFNLLQIVSMALFIYLIMTIPVEELRNKHP